MAGDGAAAGPASAVMGFVGKAVEKVTAPIDALNLAIGKATYAFVLMLPSFPAARLWSDLVFQFGHCHPHPPTFGFPLPSFGPILASGSQSVLINGLPAARCGDLGLSVWCGGYVPIFEVLTGSSHVFIGGARASRMLFDLTFHCLPEPFAGLGKVAKVQKFLTVGEVIGAGIGAGMSLLGAAAAQEEAGAAQNQASDAAAQAEAAALAASESAAIEAQMQAMMAGLSADDAANRAAAAGVAASTAIAQAAADIAAAAMSILMGKDPGVGFPLGMIITGSPNVRIGGFPMPGWMTILRGLLKMLQPVLRRVQMRLPSGRLKKALCFLTGDPVEVASGRVVTSEADFEFPGRIPIVFERSYDTSSIDYEGPLGWGWTHTFDQHLWYDRRQQAIIWRDKEGRVVGFDPLHIGERVYHPLEKVWLERTGDSEYRLTDQETQLRYDFGDTGAFESGQSEGAALRLLRISNRNDNRVELEYSSGMLSAIDDRVGLRLLLSYEQIAHGTVRLKEVRRAIRAERSAMLVTYGYSAEGDLAAVTDRTQVPFRYHYDQHLMVRRTTRIGLNFYFEYQGVGREAQCVHTWGDGGIYERWITYQPRSRVTIVRDSLGGETVYHYNELYQVTRVRNAEGGISKYEYGNAGELLLEIDELGRKRSYRYDQLYTRIEVGNGDGSKRRVQYNDASDPVMFEDEMGGQWRREYDDRGNLIATTDPLGARREFKHSATGDLIEWKDALGNVTRAEWDQAGQITSIVGPNGVRTTYRYDNERRPQEVRDESSRLTVRCDYDRAGQLERLREINTRGETISVERYDRDPEGNLTRYIDGLGNITLYRYGGFNQIIERTNALGYKRRMRYDTEERVVRIENERMENYLIEYDLADRVTREVEFDGLEHKYEYDPAGQLIRQWDSAGREIQYRRDGAGRVIKRLRGDLTSVEYGFDACGRLVLAKNPTSELKLEYDGAWRLVREEQNGVVVEYEYDLEGNRLTRRVVCEDEENNNPGVVNYEYDADGLVVAIRTAAQELRYKRDHAGRIASRELPNGLVETYRYDASGRMAAQDVGLRDPGSRIVQRAYKWDEIGCLLELRDSKRGTRRYSYDAVEHIDRIERMIDGGAGLEDQLGPAAGSHSPASLPPGRRLWEASDSQNVPRDTAGAVVEEFEYDGDGNLLERRTNRGRRRSFSYTPGDRLTQQETIRYVFDAAGNQIEKHRSDGSVIRYEYDMDNQLIAVESPDSGRIQFEYDALGRRIAKHSSKGTVGFLWDGDVLLREQRTETGPANVKVAYDYVSMPQSFVPAMRVLHDGARPASIECFHTDHLGTPQELTGQGGAILWEADYDVYGSADLKKAETEQPIRFQGQYEDSETCLYYNRHRHYDPESGRYISKDPIGLLGALNTYAYTPNPINWIDPLGLDWNPESARAKYPGIGTTKNGGPTFRGTPYLHPTTGGKKNIVKIQMQGSRGRDFTQAYREAGFTPEEAALAREKYTWHHVDDFNPRTGETTMQLVERRVHRATSGHSGSCDQFSKRYGVKYDEAEAIEYAKKRGWCKG